MNCTLLTNSNGRKVALFFEGTYAFSNWYPCTFIINGTKYNCVEQYYMHQKSLVFKDYTTAKQIMSSKNPRWIKSLGRRVKGFKENYWNQIKIPVMRRAITQKFSQNPELKVLFSFTIQISNN